MARSEQATPPQKSPASIAVRAALVVILVLLVGAFAYDYFYAQDKAKEKFDAIEEMNKDPDRDYNITREDVHKKIGPPDGERQRTNTRLVEVYSWMGGLLFTNHTVYVEYVRESASGDEGDGEKEEGAQDEWLLKNYSMNDPL